MNDQFDGQKQRLALTRAENALRALGEENTAKALKNAAGAAKLDQIGTYAGLVETIEPLTSILDAGGSIDNAGWDSLIQALGAGPLSGLIEELRD